MENKYLENPAIIITVYDRCQHIKQCLESLESAVGSKRFHVIIGSDAPAQSQHRAKVAQVREYLKAKEDTHRFKKLSVIYYENNMNERENAKGCHSFSREFGHTSFIRMEDDIVVGAYFLEYMVEALKLYSHENDVIAVSGYLDSNLNINISEPFLYNSFNAYGYGSWYEKWENVQERLKSVNYAERALSDIKLFKKQAKFTRNAKSYPFLAENYYRAGDIEIGLMMEIEKFWVLKPPVSLTANKGMDGSGLRSGYNPVLQRMEPFNVRVNVPAPNDTKRIKIELAQKRIPIKSVIINWIVYFFYKNVPAGFAVLKRLRAIKKSL